MNSTEFRMSRPAMAAVVLAGMLAATPALAALKSGQSTAAQRYQREQAQCMKVRNEDDRANCLSESSTRYAQTLPNRPEEAADILARNALKRCEPLPETERLDCVARIQGKGSTSGSVASGGIYRELVTREVVVPAAPLAAPAVEPAPPVPTK